MNIIYSRLFEVSVFHDYFRDGVSKDVKLLPTRETQELLRKGRMLWRETPQGIVVLYRATGDLTTPEVALTPPLDFFFFFQAANSPQFFTVTNLAKGPRIYQSGDFLAFQSVPANASTNPETPEKIPLDIWDGSRPKTFTTRINLNPSPANVIFRVMDASGTKISSGLDENGDPLPLDLELTPDDKGEFLVPLDLKGKAEGNYSLITA